METKHTPGPWEAVTRVAKTGFIIDSPKTKDLPYGRIADVQQYGNGSAGPMLEEATANAHLIAAAPDLLKALQGILYHFVPQQGNLKVEDDMIKQAHAAIAKATGGRA